MVHSWLLVHTTEDKQGQLIENGTRFVHEKCCISVLSIFLSAAVRCAKLMLESVCLTMTSTRVIGFRRNKTWM